MYVDLIAVIRAARLNAQDDRHESVDAAIARAVLDAGWRHPVLERQRKQQRRASQLLRRTPAPPFDTSPAGRVLDALRAAGPDGIAPADIDAPGVRNLNHALRELRARACAECDDAGLWYATDHQEEK